MYSSSCSACSCCARAPHAGVAGRERTAAWSQRARGGATHQLALQLRLSLELGFQLDVFVPFALQLPADLTHLLVLVLLASCIRVGALSLRRQATRVGLDASEARRRSRIARCPRQSAKRQKSGPCTPPVEGSGRAIDYRRSSRARARGTPSIDEMWMELLPPTRLICFVDGFRPFADNDWPSGVLSSSPRRANRASALAVGNVGRPRLAAQHRGRRAERR